MTKTLRIDILMFICYLFLYLNVKGGKIETYPCNLEIGDIGEVYGLGKHMYNWKLKNNYSQY